MLLLVNPDTYVRKLRKYFKSVWKGTMITYYCETFKISDSVRVTPLLKFGLNIFLAISQKVVVAEVDYI